MQAFLQSLDLKHDEMFTCPHCKDLPHSQLTLVMDATSIGMDKNKFKGYVSPVDKDVPCVQLW